MSTLTQAHHQWATRPADERFTSLLDMQTMFHNQRKVSRSAVLRAANIAVRESETSKGDLVVYDPLAHRPRDFAPTNWAFDQLCVLTNSPSVYLRSLPAPLAAQCLNVGLTHQKRQETGVLVSQLSPLGEGLPAVRAFTGPRYGRIWNSDVVSALVDRFGDGIHGDFRVPGEFGRKVKVTKDNTTLFAGDRDMFIFLADEERRITIKDRRDGKPGSLARGFFVWNSEVGAATFGIATFLFDYVCSNRIVWGASHYRQFKFRHTVNAPERFAKELAPAVAEYAAASAKPLEQAVNRARLKVIGTSQEDVNEFLTKHFGKKNVAPKLQAAHVRAEDRPIRTLWDCVVASTEHAKSIAHQDVRVALEAQAGKLLDLVAERA